VTETEGSGGEKPTYTPVAPPPATYTPYTTSTVYSTAIYTVTSGTTEQVTTEIISLYTTVCPIAEATTIPAAPTVPGAGYPTSSAGGEESSTTTGSSTTTVYRTVKLAPSTATVIPVLSTATVIPVKSSPVAPYPTGPAPSYPAGTGTGYPSVSMVKPSSTSVGGTSGVETYTPSPTVFTGSASKMGGSLMAVILAGVVAMLV